ncbi:UDP-galactose:beta-D-galactoside beta-1,4-galactosyltransferase [Elysia marginata]|uniref:Glycosyltransferase family 92 protein n=1 Tax=Elysia marginata TaxID=1093978 RepID=A0AAV4ILB9_9GAST|nr:UDP-galactose:beta-D-galactoside beta-1,4-galactosyltransferase [Elysia marginata]
MDPDAVFKTDAVGSEILGSKTPIKPLGKILNESFEKNRSESIRKEQDQTRVVDFTVCIPAVFKFKDASLLVEKLEMVRLLGAGRVVLYKVSVKPNVQAVLDLYTSEWTAGRESLELVVHSWKLPGTRIHYRGQMAAVDDCHNRYGWSSRYMVFDDIDELIVPLKHSNWSELIAARERIRSGNTAFMFRCSVMNNDHSSAPKEFEADAARYSSAVLSLTQRDNFIWPPIKRSKNIIDPRKVDAMGVHHVYRGKSDKYLTDFIPVDQGLLYHYRWPLTLCAPEVKDTRVATKFGKRLVARLKYIWNKLKDVDPGWKIPPMTANSTRPSCELKVKNLEKKRKKELELKKKQKLEKSTDKKIKNPKETKQKEQLKKSREDKIEKPKEKKQKEQLEKPSNKKIEKPKETKQKSD